jgi:hypothetical protein
MKHEFQRITCQDVEVVTTHPSGPAIIPLSDEQTQYGCKVCNMGIEEALTLPCPGRPLADMLSDIGTDIDPMELGGEAGSA